jgi:hypothetical protein
LAGQSAGTVLLIIAVVVLATPPAAALVTNRPTHFVAFSLLGVIILSFLCGPVLRERKIARDGQLIQAKLLRLESAMHGDTWGTRVVYEFTSPTGIVISGQAASGGEFPKPPIQFSKLVVVYLNDRKHIVL